MLDDPLIIAKLFFLSYVAGIAESFLKQFETDKPMILFLFFELKTIITCLLEIIVQPAIIESCLCARQLKDINLTDKTKFVLVDKINKGFFADVVIKKLKQSDAIISSQIKDFKKGAQVFVIMMLSKLFERSPLGSALLQCASIFNALRMSVLPREKLHEKFNILH